MKKSGQPTISDVARLSGVSKKTVSRVINNSPLLTDDTRQKVEAIVTQLGFVPNPQARALALRRNFLIGLIHDNPNAQMVLGVQEGILGALQDTPYALVVRPVDRRSPDMIKDVRDFLEQQRLAGVLFLPPISENDQLAQACRDIGCRYVRMGSVALDEPAFSVTSNDRDAVAEATRHLIGLGHSRIGFIVGPPGFRSAQERMQGFQQALSEAGISITRSMIADGNYTFDSGRAAADRLLDLSPRPTAIFASNDEMAAGVLHAAYQRGIRVPEQLSIVGFDDTVTAAHMWPPLTTVRWPIVSMARAATLKLIHPEQANAEPSLFVSSLIRRASVAAAPV